MTEVGRAEGSWREGGRGGEGGSNRIERERETGSGREKGGRAPGVHEKAEKGVLMTTCCLCPHQD